MIVKGWEERRKWRKLSPERKHQLNVFLEYLGRQALMQWTVYKYFRQVRLGLAEGDLFYNLKRKKISASTRNDAACALVYWADFVGGDEAKKIRDFVYAWKTSRRRRQVPPKEPRIGLSTEQWVELRYMADGDDSPEGLVLQLLLRSGLRIGDVLRIPSETIVDGLDVGEMVLVLKRGKRYPYPVGPFREQLEQLLEYEEWEIIQDLLGSGGYHSAVKAVNKRLKEYGEELDIARLNTHRLRHTAITEIGEREGIRFAMQCAGHDHQSTTEGYMRRPMPTRVVGDALQRVLDETATGG